jgi:hypothetical protein
LSYQLNSLQSANNLPNGFSSTEAQKPPRLPEVVHVCKFTGQKFLLEALSARKPEFSGLRGCPEINCAFDAQICPKFGRSERENAQAYWSIPSIFE